MNDALNNLSLSEQWEARSKLGGEALLDDGFFDRLAKAGEQSHQAADKAANEAGYDNYWNWIGVLGKRVSLLEDECARKAFHRIFCLRLSLDAVGGQPLQIDGDSPAAIAQCLLKNVEKTTFSPTVLRSLETLAPNSPEAKELQALAFNFSRVLAERKEAVSPLVFAQSYLGLYWVESLCKGRGVALDNMLKRFAFLSGKPLILLKIGRILFFSGAYENFPESEWQAFLAPGRLEDEHINTLSALLFLDFEAPPQWNDKLFADWLSPNIHLALSDGDFMRAELFIDQASPCSLSPYTFDQEMKITSDYLPKLEDSAAQFKESISALPLAPLQDEGEIRIAIVTTAPLDWGTPIRLAFLLLNEVLRSYPEQFRFFLYSPFGVKTNDVGAFFEESGVLVRWLDDGDYPEIPGVDPLVSKFVYMRKEFAREGIETAVYFRGSALRESLFSQLRLAPIQIYWSMGFDWPPFQNMDGFLSCVPKASMSVIVNGQPWNWFRLLYHTLPAPSPEGVQGLKDKFTQGRFVFGVLCQSFKLDCEDYIIAVAEILKQAPDSVFIWTGAYKPHNVIKYMKRHGILDRCVFMGWVDPKDAHHVIDVFLDTFPMGNGSSSAEAMSTPKPVVSWAGADHYLVDYFFEPAESGWFGEQDQKKFKEIIGDGGYVLCETVDDYVKQAVRLYNDEGYREKVASVCHSLAQGLLFNKSASVECFVGAIKDIVKRVRELPR